MNTFTITFKNAIGEWKTAIMQLDFITVQEVIDWFEKTLGIRVKSISKH